MGTLSTLAADRGVRDCYCCRNPCLILDALIGSRHELRRIPATPTQGRSAVVRKEDTKAFQTDRLKKLVAVRAPWKTITFDESHAITVRFRITDPKTGVVLIAPVSEWMPSELADKSDDALWKFVERLAEGRL